MRNIKYIVIHCTGANQNQTVDSIKNYWKNVLGWKNVGYHHLISADGKDNQLASIETVTNGVAGYNSNSIHLSYIGGENGKDNRTDAQKKTLENLVRKYKKQFPNAIIQGHRDFPGVTKSCPSFNVKVWLKEIGL